MCGILGILPAVRDHQFQMALNTLAHRGPDAEGLWSDSMHIMLGHRRLSILDLSPEGHQPMLSRDERYVMVFNGEIYNFIEIRDELVKKGHVFKSQGDSEVLLAAYAEWKEACLEKLNGMWAFAIWDQKEKTLFLSRDRFGKKPLFYARIGDCFVFASEMKAIYPFLPEIKPSPEFDWMAKNYFLYEMTEKCLVEGIRRFPAGHWGILKDDNLRLRRYWNTLDNLIIPPSNYDEQVEVFRELFVDACRIRMRSDVPVGTALSGGLDSSATISTMSHIANKEGGDRISEDWQHAFVAAFPGTPLDESRYARKVVEHIGIDATFLEVNPLRHLDKLEEYLYLFEEIYLTSPIPMMETYGAIREHGVTVTLDGHGADELFSGYGRSLFEAFPDAGLQTRGIKSIFDAYQDLNPRSEQFEKQSPLAQEYLGFMLRWFAKKILGRGYVSRDARHPNFKKLDHFTRHLYVLTHETILPTLLRNYDRYSMSNSVEIRMPFMDHRLVTYAMSLPGTAKSETDTQSASCGTR